MAGAASETGRKVLEASEVGNPSLEWNRAERPTPPGLLLVRTGKPLGVIAVYLCEPESDDGAIENSLVAAPPVAGEFLIWRVTG